MARISALRRIEGLPIIVVFAALLGIFMYTAPELVVDVILEAAR